jgi:hypothetical protein
MPASLCHGGRRDKDGVPLIETAKSAQVEDLNHREGAVSDPPVPEAPAEVVRGVPGGPPYLAGSIR